ncbi:MAG: cobalamin B12-binding domain-containing protein [Candidatus Brocadiales bacterium]
MSENIRVLVAKVGLDGHDRGAKVVAKALSEADGVEVIYGGLHQTPEAVVERALKENVSLIAISILSGAHMAVFPRVLELLKEKGAGNIKIFGGGIIPQDDIKALQKMGVGKLFSPGTTLGEIVEYVKSLSN